MEPIVLTKYGETLKGYPGVTTGDEGKLSCCIGVHAVCNGWVDIKEVSETHNALTCRSCGLRVVIPNTLKTYRDLRRHCASWRA